MLLVSIYHCASRLFIQCGKSRILPVSFIMATALATCSEGGSGGLKIDTILESGTP